MNPIFLFSETAPRANTANLCYRGSELLPQRVVRCRRRNTNRLFANRVNKRNPACMQAYSSVRIAALGAVFQITFDRASYRRQLATDLMVPTGLQIDFQERVVFAFRERFVR